MNNLKDFIEKKKQLIDQYKKVEKMDIFPIENITLSEFVKQKQNLVDEIFYVSFTGQIKAGKSTLINALIFGDDILPADDLPHTAKITIIKYSETPYFQVDFYTENEWEILRNQKIERDGVDTNFFDSYLREDIKRSKLSPLEFIGASSVKIENLSELKNYIAKDGRFKPFVKIVTVFYDNPILKDIVFVDTPGINDPNPVRSRVTTDWIHKTDANIFLTYAGQAMSEQDFKFIDQYLFGVDTSKKITVVNKIDTLESDIGNLKDYITKLRNQAEFKRRNIFGDEDSIIYTSSLGALIDKIYDKTQSIPDRYIEDAERLESCNIDYLEKENHNLVKLQKVIESKLIDNKGNHIIESKANFIKTLFDRKLRELNIFKDRELQLLSIYQSNVEDLNKEYKKIQANKSKIEILFEDTIGTLQKKQTEVMLKFNKVISTIEVGMREESYRKIDGISKIKYFKNEVLWSIKNVIDERFNDIYNEADYAIDELSAIIKDNLQLIEQELHSIDVMKFSLLSKVIEFYEVDIFSQVSKIKEQANEHFDSSKIASLINSNSNGWQRFWETKGGLRNIKVALKEPIYNFFNDFLAGFFKKSFQLAISDRIYSVMDSLKDDIKNIVSTKQDEIDLILADIHNKKEKEIQHQNELKRIDNVIKSINKHKKEIVDE